MIILLFTVIKKENLSKIKGGANYMWYSVLRFNGNIAMFIIKV